MPDDALRLAKLRARVRGPKCPFCGDPMLELAGGFFSRWRWTTWGCVLWDSCPVAPVVKIYKGRRRDRGLERTAGKLNWRDYSTQSDQPKEGTA